MSFLKKWLQDTLLQWSHYLNIAIIIAVIAALAWWHFKPQPKPAGIATVAQQAPQLAHIPTETIKPPGVVVFKQEAKKKLPLPAAVQADPNQHVLASSRIPADTHPQNVTTTIDAATGQTATYVTREPLPWLAAQQTGEARIDYGWKGAATIARLTVREDLLQVKALHAGVNASIDTDGQLFVGAGIGWRW